MPSKQATAAFGSPGLGTQAGDRSELFHKRAARQKKGGFRGGRGKEGRRRQQGGECGRAA